MELKEEIINEIKKSLKIYLYLEDNNLRASLYLDGEVISQDIIVLPYAEAEYDDYGNRR